ncbi:MAG TPA: HAD family acid phosphatase [Nocardioides sp.]|uniref:HAD family acid phosphatase n=1 Tax=uncultured Nocardioides sp. TaxID=198441 RepID=UPI000ED8B5A7|nr:HAD family acid phosphatase [uncultured Nocardioides sp.]HCB04435.1 acid phosphatase [Nocardioides sp.]HRD61274.1 HAD family acid phosphatase [Nocardioides sp.]HRI97351.1 HAD family acid phosphatase [Nocardioides sp.]HRK47266.1 HAD family acid phosphatase [Nocardioides sp.]
MTRLLLAPLLALVLAAGLCPAAPAQARDVPSREQWLADVATVMTGSYKQFRARIAAKDPDEVLAVNFDIDNTVLATYYDGGGAIPRMLKLARFLDRRGVAVLFNTGRVAGMRKSTTGQLQRNGFPVDALCLRGQGRTLVYGKQRCRDLFAARGYTLIANIGNNDTDFEGDGYERAYRLPNYDGVLG